jgi:hypothetical protein
MFKMAFNKKHIILARNIAAAIKATNPDLDITKVLKLLAADFKSRQQSISIGKLDYQKYLTTSINPDTFTLMIGQEANPASSSMQPLINAFNVLLSFRFNATKALDWLTTTTLDYATALPIMKDALGKMNVLTTERHETISVCLDIMLNKESEFYVKGLNQQIWNELLNSELQLDIRKKGRRYALDDEFEDLFDSNAVTYDNAVLDAIAEAQATTQDYSEEHNPMLKNLRDQARAAWKSSTKGPYLTSSQLQVADNYPLTFAANSSPAITMSMAQNLNNNSMLVNGMFGAAVILALAATIGCVVYGPARIIRYSANKFYTLFGSKDDVTVSTVGRSNADDANNGCLDRFVSRYSRSQD